MPKLIQTEAIATADTAIANTTAPLSSANQPKSKAAKAKPSKTPKTKADGAPTIRTGTKQAKLIEMLKRPRGATIDEVTTAFGWLPHTARVAISHGLAKRLNFNVESSPDDQRGRV